MKLIIAVLFLACCVAVFGARHELKMHKTFSDWMKLHNKVYPSSEFRSRYTTWKTNAKWVEEFNNQNVGFRVGMNKFADLSNSEFNALYKGLKLKEPLSVSPITSEINPTLPASVDWRTKGVVTGIKNQGQCGSCWSFSTTGSLEGAHAIRTGTLVGMSEQNLMDCSTSEGNEGCDGGLMDDAFQYIINNQGIDSEASYPYTAEDGYCHYSAANCVSTLQAYSDVTPSGSEASLQTAVATIGPVSVAIDASHNSFQLYTSGVYYEPDCSSTSLDHGVLSVGYGSSSGADYWIVKNSWGTDWGMAGYIWMSRNRNNNCGIATMASYPISAGATNCA